MFTKKEVIIRMYAEVEDDYTEEQNNLLIRDDIESELSCCWHHFDIASIQIMDYPN